MSSNDVQVSGGGVGFFGLLGVLFIGLKLTGYINWSWWLVLLPVYGPVALAVLIVLVCLLAALCFTGLAAVLEKMFR
jgi:hypothetical protein